MSTSVEFKDNSNLFLQEMGNKAEIILELIGQSAAGHASDLAPRDTGTLARSISHNVGNDYVDIGSNLPYAPINELGGITKKYPARPYLRPAVLDNKNEYKQIAETVMKK